jgi:PPOX class probable F420-dependent enzyme
MGVQALEREHIISNKGIHSNDNDRNVRSRDCQISYAGNINRKLATVNKDGSSHVVPIWFVLDNKNNRHKVGNIVFTTSESSAKANNIRRDNKVSICVDDQTPPFSFVSVFGIAKTYPYKQNEVLKWATKIAGRYMGEKNAESYGRRNSEEGSVLVRIKPTRIVGEKDVTGWD